MNELRAVIINDGTWHGGDAWLPDLRDLRGMRLVESLRNPADVPCKCGRPGHYVRVRGLCRSCDYDVQCLKIRGFARRTLASLRRNAVRSTYRHNQKRSALRAERRAALNTETRRHGETQKGRST